MKRNKNFNPFFRMLFFLSMILLISVITAIGLFYYVFSIPEPEGISIAHWPQTFTNSFSAWTAYQNGTLSIEQTGLDRLDEYGLWIQFIDESGEEIFSHNKPAGYPLKYSASELIALSNSDYHNGYTIFAGILDNSKDSCSYLIGFPYDIGKYTLHYNGGRVARLSPVARTLILFASGTLIVCTLVYGLWLTRKLSEITDGIRHISFRSYEAVKERGTFREIYSALNKMNREILHADQINEETEKNRREWIANITHDLKTPLSPIKGYAEILADSSAPDTETVREYGSIILKNVNHMASLINDLKLTYQLDAGSVPFHPRKIPLSRYVRECIIDIINDPVFSQRDITFESNTELQAHIDPDLFRRAVSNLVINALLHNTEDTKVSIILDADKTRGILLSIRDNGKGFSGQEQSRLFQRYYRGTNTKEKPEGTGLGLAIANQIVMLHGGRITVQSAPGSGTEFTICLPCGGPQSSPGAP